VQNETNFKKNNWNKDSETRNRKQMALFITYAVMRLLTVKNNFDLNYTVSHKKESTYFLSVTSLNFKRF